MDWAALCYSGFDPIEDTESWATSGSSFGIALSYSGFDPIEDTESWLLADGRRHPCQVTVGSIR